MPSTEAVQGSLDPYLKGAFIIKSEQLSASATDVYVNGGTFAPGRCRWIRVNPSDAAATQAAAIRAGLLA